MTGYNTFRCIVLLGEWMGKEHAFLGSYGRITFVESTVWNKYDYGLITTLPNTSQEETPLSIETITALLSQSTIDFRDSSRLVDAEAFDDAEDDRFDEEEAARGDGAAFHTPRRWRAGFERRKDDMLSGVAVEKSAGVDKVPALGFAVVEYRREGKYTADRTEGAEREFEE